VVLSQEKEIGEEELSLPGGTGAPDSGHGYPPGTPLSEVERDHILRTLKACDNNRTEAARRLGIGRNTLARKLKKS